MARRAEERFAYGSVLEAVSRGLYPDKRHVVREFVQNAYDGLFELRKHYPREILRPIEIKVQPPSIFIGDYGIGMPDEKMHEYRYLGFSEKQRTELAGFRGIGKYSGLAIAEKIIVNSSPYGIPLRYQVVIHVGAMIGEVEKKRNPPLEELLRKFTELAETSERKEAHYTFVELHRIRRDSLSVMDEKVLAEYLSRIAPVPLDPNFKHAEDIEEALVENIPDFFEVPLKVNGVDIYKRVIGDCKKPEFETVLFRDDKPEVLAFAWYCQNAKKGQFKQKDASGLIYRVKNIAVGDRHLTRKTLWNTTPERAFHFFGEIHILDSAVIPSADRTDFEDNSARKRMSKRCISIASNVSRKAGEESATRRFREVLVVANKFLDEQRERANRGKLPVELRDEVLFELQTLREDIQKRVPGSKESLKRRGKQFLGRSQKFLARIKSERTIFFDLQKELRLNKKMKALYEAVIGVLKDEFRHDRERLERIIGKIHEALKTRKVS